MTRQQFIQFANEVSLRLAQERARNFRISETQIELWSNFWRHHHETAPH